MATMNLLDPDGNETSLENVIESISPSTYLQVLDRSRSYDGQGHTPLGERGKTEVQGLTARDIYDCFIRACYDGSGLPVEEWPRTIYALPWADMDPLAVVQNLLCWIERYMGIYPNVPRLKEQL